LFRLFLRPLRTTLVQSEESCDEDIVKLNIEREAKANVHKTKLAENEVR
jgi:hypothetical protein